MRSSSDSSAGDTWTMKMASSPLKVPWMPVTASSPRRMISSAASSCAVSLRIAVVSSHLLRACLDLRSGAPIA